MTITKTAPQCTKCRRFLGAQGSTSRRARGLCRRCYNRLTPDERLDHQRTSLARDDLLDDWAVLRMEGYSKRQAAERLGVTFEAFDRAFHRARRDGDPRALPALDVS